MSGVLSQVLLTPDHHSRAGSTDVLSVKHYKNYLIRFDGVCRLSHVILSSGPLITCLTPSHQRPLQLCTHHRKGMETELNYARV